MNELQHMNFRKGAGWEDGPPFSKFELLHWLKEYGERLRWTSCHMCYVKGQCTVRRSQGKMHIFGEMYIDHGRLCVCLSLPNRIPTLLHGAGCNLGEW